MFFRGLDVVRIHGRYMVELTPLMKLIGSDSEADWSCALFALAEAQGFEYVLYATIASKHAKLATAFFHSNYPAAWQERYHAQKLHYVDPAVAHCLGSVVPIVWQPDIYQTPEQRRLHEQACGFGLRSGISFPIHGPSGDFGVLSFASNQPASEKFGSAIAHFLPDLALIRDYAFASSQRFVSARSGAEPMPHLTKRELEVINWVMVVKSSWEISKITSCSEATINFHMSNIRQKFHVNTRQQALVKAIALGIIKPEDQHR